MVPQTGILESEKNLRPGVHLFPHADDRGGVAMVDTSAVYNISIKWYPTQAENEIFWMF